MEDMNAMVASANSQHLTTTGEALVDAQSKIQGVADDLKSHLSSVSWQGDSARAFQNWGSQLTTQSYDLADYTGLVGEQLITAGSSLQYVQKAMPKSKRTECFVDPKKEQAAVKAEEPDRQEAITLMESLSSSYKWANGQISGGKAPNFQPVPYTPTGGLIEAYVRPYGSAVETPDTDVTPDYDPGDASRDAVYNESGSDGGVTAGRSGAQTSVPETDWRPASRTSLDSVAPPSTVTAARPPASARGGHDSPGTERGMRSGMLPPPYRTVETPPARAGGVVRVPPEASLNEGDEGPGFPSSARSLGGGDAGQGIFGGTPQALSNPRSAGRYGRAIGGEAEVSAPGATAGFGSAPVSATSGVPSRRAGETISGQEQLRASAEEPAQFTSGGSGLVGGRSVGGLGTPGTPVGRGGRQGAARPDYLQEEEETWDVGRTDVVPPVLG
ncbi:hypothetical protein ABZ832_30360 [Streptantibioticus parmotrematis]|uniref:hypothetical protein n=1 Tax=Streptantibioticus parmotrematis TaxID=2873249 RepID=UPI0033FD6424